MFRHCRSWRNMVRGNFWGNRQKHNDSDRTEGNERKRGGASRHVSSPTKTTAIPAENVGKVGWDMGEEKKRSVMETCHSGSKPRSSSRDQTTSIFGRQAKAKIHKHSEGKGKNKTPAVVISVKEGCKTRKNPWYIGQYKCGPLKSCGDSRSENRQRELGKDWLENDFS